MKQVGILTFHRVANYGAILQAYALKQVCDDLGYEAHIINYRNDEMEEFGSPVRSFLNGSHSVGSAVRCVRKLMSYVGDKKRWKGFVQFRKEYLSESAECSSVDEIKQLGYDVYIAGSDQIWNYRITGGEFDPAFFLQMETEAKRVIYAASSQDTPFPKNMELKFAELLRNTDCPIGIREEKLAVYAEKITGVRYSVVLDPTLLAGKEIFERLKTPGPPKKEYILLYQIDANPYTDISVRTLEHRFECPVYTMTVPRLGSVHGRKGEATPEQFLALLKGAKFLVTNSFHGIALSLLFEKNFYVYENGGVMTRIDGLLELCHLLNRKVKVVQDIDENSSVDYSKVRPYLEKARVASMEFLKSGLQGEKVAVVNRSQDTAEKSCATTVADFEKKDCCGCTACVNVCPVHAITMQNDGEGFLYPNIQPELCIGCKKCVRVCSFFELSEEERPLEKIQAYGVKHNKINTRLTSRSGGAFVAFSDIVLNNNGSVYGAAMDEKFRVSHVRATDKNGRDAMKKAKYVQSIMGDTFSSVAEDLMAGKKVLFSGTPCQVAGLQSYLKMMHIDTDNLVCCDLVCHGVPSPAIWQKYLCLIETKYGGKILNAQFRDKEFGWDSHVESFEIDGRKKKVVTREYTDLFYQHIMFRPSCHNCQFANLHRPGDLTLADFWGIEKHDSVFDDNKGVSLILVNTEKGQELFNQAKPDLETIKCAVLDCLQPTLVKPSVASPRREMFWKDYERLPFAELVSKYTTPASIIPKLKRAAKQVLYSVGIRKHP